MTKFLEFFGLLISSASVVFGAWELHKREKPHLAIVGVSALGVIMGILLVFKADLIEIQIGGIATLRQRAQSEVDAIEKLKMEVSLIAEDSRKKANEFRGLIESLRTNLTSMSSSITNSEKKIDELEGRVSSSISQIDIVSGEMRYLTNFALAMGGSHRGYKALVALSRDRASPFQGRAGTAWNVVAQMHAFNPYFRIVLGQNQQFNDKIPTASGEELEKSYFGLKSHERVAAIVSVGENEKRSKKDKLSFMARVVELDDDLRACFAANYFYSTNLNRPQETADLGRIVDDWKVKRDSL